MFLISIPDCFVTTTNKVGSGSGEGKLRIDNNIAEHIFQTNLDLILDKDFREVKIVVDLSIFKIHLLNLKKTYEHKFNNLELFYKRLDKIQKYISSGRYYFEFNTQVKKFKGGGGAVYITRPQTDTDDYDFLFREINLSPSDTKSFLVIDINGSTINIVNIILDGFEERLDWGNFKKQTIEQYYVHNIQDNLIYLSRGVEGKYFIIPKQIIKAYLQSYIKKKIPLNGSINTSEMKRLVLDSYQDDLVWDNYTLGQHAANAHISRFVILNPSLLLNIDPKPRAAKLPQLILQGPPGTGKSHQLDARLSGYGIDQDSDRFERVVGHPELTSADFIGQYRPMTKGANAELEYCFVPGPFTRLLKQALGDPKQAYILIIEELNRTNAAAMFAEVFQLLDRRDDGQSKYGVNLGADVNRYLLKKEDEETSDKDEERISRHKVRLPANFAIWATMNTADQGVFPMDTAFKRRWSFEYLGVNEGEEIWGKADPQKSNPWNPMIMDDGSMDWQSLRKGINQVLSQHGKDEDRQLGGFFLTQRELGWDPMNGCLVDNHLAIIQQNIMTKVIGYLRDDVLRYEPHVLFIANEQQAVPGFSGLISQMKREGILSVFRANDVQTWQTEFQKYIARHHSVNPTTDESDPNLTEEIQEDTQEYTQPDTQQELQNPADSDDENQD